MQDNPHLRRNIILITAIALIAVGALLYRLPRGVQGPLPIGVEEPQLGRDQKPAEAPLPATLNGNKIRILPTSELAQLAQEFNANSDEGTRGRGHPDYGHYPSQEALLENLLLLTCTAISPTTDPVENLNIWTAKRSAWNVGGQSHDRIPIALLTDKPLTLDQIAELMSIDARYTEELGELSAYAFDSLRLAAEEYVYRDLKRIPRGEEYGDASNAKPEDVGEYHLFTNDTAGEWEYILDFRSADYPAFNEAMVRLRLKTEERASAIHSKINQF